MNFPHLRDTAFPDIQTVDVYKYQNNFDYTRWSEDTRIKLCNVLWNSDYRNVVTFETNVLRDNWFDSLSDYYTIELAQAARIVPESYIKLPIPYDVMARYNYLFIDMPIATSANAQIDYENSNGIRRWYFFIDSIAYLSPNSTQVFLNLDVWTNYQNEVEINYMMLERGHAPVKYSDVDTYLANPIANNRYLLAPDVNFDNAGITRSSDYVPFGNGQKYVCIASTCGADKISTIGSVTVDPSYNPTGTITYSDVSERYGHQLQVNGFTVGNGRDYSNARTPANVGTSNNGLIPNNLTVYAIAATECYGNGTFFPDIISQCPQFLSTVRACFVVDGACLTLGNSHTIAGHTLRECVGTSRNLLTKQLQKTDFAYPQEYQRFAKLYTSPYAKLEITDNDGTTYEVNIEETSTLQVNSVVSVAFPYIDYRVYLDGIGGVGSQSYSWVDLRGNTAQLGMSNSDWFKYCFDWQIPTFALYMDGETAYELSTFNRNVRMGISNALVAYHNSMRSANTAMENANDSADTAQSNVYASTTTAKANADDSADTGKSNSDDNADTFKTNSDDSANTAYVNVDNSCNTIRANTNIAIATIAANEEDAITTNSSISTHSRNLVTAKAGQANAQMALATGVNNETSIATTKSSGLASMQSSAVGGIMGGAGMGAGMGAAVGSAVPGIGTAIGAVIGGLGGMLIGAVGAGIMANVNNENAIVTTQANSQTVSLTQTANTVGASTSNTTTFDIQTDTNNHQRTVYTNNNNSTDSQCTNNNANDRTNANNTRNTTIANALRSQLTAKANALRTQVTAKANALRNYNTDRANADRTHDVGVANSGYTRQVSELNAKEVLENAANTAMAGINDARNDTPLSIGATSGNAAADYMRTRGIQIKVKTQSDSAIRQAGDAFARYGYALNQVWDVGATGLDLMEHFTYWKASDIWIDDRESSNNSINEYFEKIFLDGVTVWNDPNEIGRVSIYDN